MPTVSVAASFGGRSWKENGISRIEMQEPGFYVTSPEALLARAAQSLEAKRLTGLFLGCAWEYVDDNLPECLVLALDRLPQQAPIRRQQDRIVLRSIARLVADVSRDDPRRRTIQRRVSQTLRRGTP